MTKYAHRLLSFLTLIMKQQESNREDMKHHAIKLLLGGQLSLAPIANEPRRVLDVGTGTGEDTAISERIYADSTQASGQ